MTQETPEHADPVDALKALAAAEPVQEDAADPVSLTDGPPDDQDAEGGDPADSVAAGDALDALDGGPADPFAAAAEPDPAARAAARARAEAIQRKTKLSSALQLRQAMIPVLLVVGGILAILGVIVLATTSWSQAAPIEASWKSDPFVRKVLGFSAFPLGGILLLAAYIFRRDVQRLKRSLATD